MNKSLFLSVLPLLVYCIKIDAQTYIGSQNIIQNTDVNGAHCVYAADLDSDGDMDVLSASYENDIIAWFQNDGSGSFGSKQVVCDSAIEAHSVYAADMDGDGDMDILSASLSDDKIAWYQNNGSGTFGAQQVISTAADGPTSVRAADIDGDGDMDVLSASYNDDKVAWYQNDGSGSFGSQQVITTSADGAIYVYAADIDGDGDVDVLSASTDDDKIAWYQNDGSGSFGEQKLVTSSTDFPRSVYAADMDGDGDMDVLSASAWDDKIAWYQNNGSGSFGEQQVITTDADAGYSVFAADIDGDDDMDVLSASRNDDKIAWYQNDGNGVFGAQQVITTAADGAYSVYAVDLDGDEDMDVLSASRHDNKIAWYQNFSLEILKQPVDKEALVNATSFFSVKVKDNDSFQWQENKGVGFADITDNTVYSGTNSDTLFISTVPADMDGYFYRCILSNNAGSDTTNSVVLSVVENTWIEDLSVSDIEVYPNPVEDYLAIEVDASALVSNQKMQYQLFDMQGRLLQGNIIVNGVKQSQSVGQVHPCQCLIDMQNYKPGIYYVKICTKGSKAQAGESTKNKEFETFTIVKR